MDATFVASGPSLAAVGDALGITLPTTAKFATHGRLRKHGSVWDAGIAAMDIGTSRLNGNFKFDNGPDIPVLTDVVEPPAAAVLRESRAPDPIPSGAMPQRDEAATQGPVTRQALSAEPPARLRCVRGPPGQ